MELAELSTMLKPFFTQKPEKSVEGILYSCNTENQLVPGWTDFFSGSLQRKLFAIIKYSGRQTKL